MYKEYQAYKIEKADELWEKTLNIPCSVNLQYEDILRVIEELKNG
jgi:dTDP-4-amino-4,6-dideoxygalactose transaminase